MYVQILQYKTAVDFEKDESLKSLKPIDEIKELNEGIVNKLILLSEDESEFLVILFWQDRETMLKVFPRYAMNPEINNFLQFVDGAHFNNKGYTIVDKWPADQPMKI
ncbi:MAG: hypothetical protein ABSB12_01980 [Candidatus Saccharimonadales bacterium]|jgi:hypothetical protein